MGKNLLILMALVVFSFLLLSCAPTIPVTMKLPARYEQASLIKEVAVLPFKGRGGAEFSHELEALLTSIEIKGNPYFKVHDRAELEKVMSEQKLSHSGLFDERKAAELGKAVGAKAIYTGIVNVNGTKDSHYNEERSKCTQHEMKKDKKGNSSEGKCIKWGEYNVSCTKRQANFSVTPKLIDVTTTRIIYSTVSSGSAESSACKEDKPLKTEQELLDTARDAAKNAIRYDVAPYFMTVMVKLKDSTDGIDSTQVKSKLKTGILYAKENRLETACELWNEAKQMAPNSPSLTYNLAVCAESNGDLKNAQSLYKQADRLIGKPDKDITLGLNRVNLALSNDQRLQGQVKYNDDPKGHSSTLLKLLQ